MNRTQTTTGLAIAMLVGVWSFSWVVMKSAQAYCGPFLFGTLACGLGALCAFAGYASRGKLPRCPPAAFLGIAGVIGVGFFQAFAQLALSGGGAGKTILLIYSMPFWASALAWLWLREAPTRAQKIGLGVAAFGLFLVVAPWEAAAVTASLWALASGLCWAAGSVATRKLMTQGTAVTLVEASTWQLAVGTIPLAILWAFSPEHGFTPTPGFIGALAYNAILCGVPAWALWGLVVKRLPMAGAGLVSLLIPMAGVGWAWRVLGERPGGIELAGMAVILIALALSSLPARAVVPGAVLADGLERGVSEPATGH